jgi:hypothetical protein
LKASMPCCYTSHRRSTHKELLPTMALTHYDVASHHIVDQKITVTGENRSAVARPATSLFSEGGTAGAILALPTPESICQNSST